MKAGSATTMAEAKQEADVPGDILAVISMAIYEHQEAEHDYEDAILTVKQVKRSYSPWMYQNLWIATNTTTKILKISAMKEFKYKINGNLYTVNINQIEDNIATVEVNGTPYKVELDKPAKKQIKPLTRPPGSSRYACRRTGRKSSCRCVGSRCRAFASARSYSRNKCECGRHREGRTKSGCSRSHENGECDCCHP